MAKTEPIEWDGETVEVPVGLTDEQVAAYMRSQKGLASTSPAEPTWLNMLRDKMPKDKLDALGQVFSGVTNGVSMGDVGQSTVMNLLLGPLAPASQAMMGSKSMLDKAQTSSGMEKAGYGLAAAVPFVGPAAAQAGEKIAEKPVEGLANAASLLFMPALAKKMATRPVKAPVEADYMAQLKRITDKAEGKHVATSDKVIGGLHGLAALFNMFVRPGVAAQHATQAARRLANSEPQIAPLPSAPRSYTPETSAPNTLPIKNLTGKLPTLPTVKPEPTNTKFPLNPKAASNPPKAPAGKSILGKPVPAPRETKAPEPFKINPNIKRKLQSLLVAPGWERLVRDARGRFSRSAEDA